VFLAHAVQGGAIEPVPGHASPMPAGDGHFDRFAQAVAVLCEEEALDGAAHL
jgi:hypothetical protein